MCRVKLHSYVVARDYGFAPNPFYGICTLATCKPRLRSVARKEDWIVGIGSKARRQHIVYAMRVTGALTFNEYWDSPRFQQKKPNLKGSKKQAFGDNIYFEKSGKWHQADSHHSLANGKVNLQNLDADTQTDRVLLSEDFIYWGGYGPKIPAKFFDYGPDSVSISVVRGHKNNFPDGFVSQFIQWIRSLDEMGCVGEPLDWKRTP